MDFDMFYEELKKQILEFVTEEVKGTIDFRMVYKNGQQNHGIVFRPEGSNVGITTYAEDFYRMYKEGISFPSIRESYAGTLHEAKDEIQFTKNIQILEAKKENIIPAFIPKESLEFRPKLAHVPFENLEIIFQWNVPGTEYSVKLPEEYFNYHQIEPKQFLAELIDDPSFKNQTEVFSISRLFGPGDIEIPKEQEMYCVTNQNKNWGAASILNKDIMDEIADFFGGETYILPASIHECLAVDTHAHTIEELKTMVRDINSKPDLVGADFLSNEVYVYDSYTRELKLAGEQRTKEIQNPEKQEPIKR